MKMSFKLQLHRENSTQSVFSFGNLSIGTTVNITEIMTHITQLIPHEYSFWKINIIFKIILIITEKSCI